MPHRIPNALTASRVALIPVLVVLYYLPHPLSGPLASTVFIIAALTDWADGWLARRLKVQSAFGAFLDPVADKLMVATALVLLVSTPPAGLHPAWLALPATIIIGREIAVSALREWMAQLGAAAKVKVALAGKVKTAAQMLAIALLLWGTAGNSPMEGGHPAAGGDLAAATQSAGLVLLWLAAVLSLTSGFGYLRAGLQHHRHPAQGDHAPEAKLSD